MNSSYLKDPLSLLLLKNPGNFSSSKLPPKDLKKLKKPEKEKNKMHDKNNEFLIKKQKTEEIVNEILEIGKPKIQTPIILNQGELEFFESCQIADSKEIFNFFIEEQNIPNNNECTQNMESAEKDICIIDERKNIDELEINQVPNWIFDQDQNKKDIVNEIFEKIFDDVTLDKQTEDFLKLDIIENFDKLNEKTQINNPLLLTQNYFSENLSKEIKMEKPMESKKSLNLLSGNKLFAIYYKIY